MEKKFAKTFNEKVQELITETKEREALYGVLDNFLSDNDMKKLISELRKIINEPKRIPIYNEIRPLIPAKHQMMYDRLAPRRDLNKTRIIRLTRRSNEGLGFSVRGGLEHEVGIYVSEVDRDSMAFQQGLRAGDEIVRLNGFTISQAIHHEVLNLIKARNELILKVRNVGMIPVKDKPGAPLTWRYVDIDNEPRDKLLTSRVKSSENSPGEVVNLFINVPIDGGLGCSICSGPSVLPGIFIQSVKQGGLAAEAGLEVGDQVLKVNGTSFNNITHSEAIVAFKSTKHLDLVVQKGSGLELFKPRTDPSLTLIGQSHEDEHKPVAPPRHKRKDSKRKTEVAGNSLSNGHVSSVHISQNPDPKDSALQNAINALDVPQNDQVKGQQLKTKAEVHHSLPSPPATSSKENRKSWIFQKEERLEDGESSLESEPIYATIPADSNHGNSKRESNHGHHHDNKIKSSKPTSTTTLTNHSSQTPNVPATPRRQPFTSPTYIPDHQTNYRIQKPVLLHPTQKTGDRRSATLSPVADGDAGTTDITSSSFHGNDYTRLLTNEQIAGREIRQVKIDKAGYDDLGIVIESKLDRILIAEIYSGGAVHKNGDINVGDQLMLVGGQLLVGMPIEQVYTVLKQQFKSATSQLEIVVAKAPPNDHGNEVTYF